MDGDASGGGALPVHVTVNPYGRASHGAVGGAPKTVDVAVAIVAVSPSSGSLRGKAMQVDIRLTLG